MSRTYIVVARYWIQCNKNGGLPESFSIVPRRALPLGRRGPRWSTPSPTRQCVLFHGHVAAGLANGSQKLLGPSLSRTQTGDGVGQLLSGRSLTGHLALHTAHLPYLGPVPGSRYPLRAVAVHGYGFPTVAVPPALPSRGQLFRVVRQTAGQYQRRVGWLSCTTQK